MTKLIYLIGILISLDAYAGFRQIKVAIVDTGLDLSDKRFARHLCKAGGSDLTGEGINDTIGHGTHVAGIVVLNTKNPNYCLMIYKYWSESASGNVSMRRSVNAFKLAIKQGADIINYSSNGEAYDKEEYEVIKNNPKVKFIVAAGNDHLDLDSEVSYPASYWLDNEVVVGALGTNGKIYPSSNYGNQVVYEEGESIMSYIPNGMGTMSGTSMATALRTAKILNSYVKK